jgi:DNA-directed RNA polymerase
VQIFTGYQYIQIDIANNYGLDKETWDTRLEFVQTNKTNLEKLVNKADSPVLYTKAVRAYRKAQADEPVNHLVGLDATASGKTYAPTQ